MRVTLTVTVKAGLSSLHLNSSILFANVCSQIEDEESNLPWPQPSWDKARSYASAAVILAVAALESSVNELYQQAIDRDVEALKSLTKEQMSLLEQLWPEIERFPILRKYQVALTVKHGNGMDIGKEPYQSASSLVEFRNGLVHFKPEWDDSLDAHLKLENRLRQYFKQSRLTEKETGDMVWFPKRCLGAGSAIWAAKTAIRFSKEFSNLMGIKDRLYASMPLL
jgi:hypothetical protein